jgi:hypothetical protein
MPNRASNFLLALMLAAATAAAQEVTPTPVPAASPGPQPQSKTTDASGVVLAAKSKDYLPAPPIDSDGETRSVSAKIAADLSLGMPKFNPPTPTPVPTAEPQDMRDVDKPKNGIIRLPKYVVREARPPIFRNRDLYTKEGILDLTMKSHAGLMFGNILGLNANNKPGSPAYQMMVDDQRQENMDDLADTAHAMARGGDSAESSYILQQSQATYSRGGAWDWSGTGPIGTLTGDGGK